MILRNISYHRNEIHFLSKGDESTENDESHGNSLYADDMFDDIDDYDTYYEESSDSWTLEEQCSQFCNSFLIVFFGQTVFYLALIFYLQSKHA